MHLIQALITQHHISPYHPSEDLCNHISSSQSNSLPPPLSLCLPYTLQLLSLHSLILATPLYPLPPSHTRPTPPPHSLSTFHTLATLPHPLPPSHTLCHPPTPSAALLRPLPPSHNHSLHFPGPLPCLSYKLNPSTHFLNSVPFTTHLPTFSTVLFSPQVSQSPAEMILPTDLNFLISAPLPSTFAEEFRTRHNSYVYWRLCVLYKKYSFSAQLVCH
jgi:hypothetical protein